MYYQTKATEYYTLAVSDEAKKAPIPHKSRLCETVSADKSYVVQAAFHGKSD